MTPNTPTEIDFAAIRAAYPAAFACLIAYALQEPYETIAPMVAKAPDSILWHSYQRFAYHPRELYDFFDQQGVWVCVDTAFYDERIFYARISLIGLVWLSVEYPTRAGAEAAAFLAGFGKLEELLDKKGGEQG